MFGRRSRAPFLSDEGQRAAGLLRETDEALYAAKAQGRDRVISKNSIALKTQGPAGLVGHVRPTLHKAQSGDVTLCYG